MHEMMMGFHGYGHGLHAHASLALQLIALVSGVLLFNKAHGEGFFCKKTGKVIGAIVSILAILSIVCSLYLLIRASCQRRPAAPETPVSQIELFVPAG